MAAAGEVVEQLVEHLRLHAPEVLAGADRGAEPRIEQRAEPHRGDLGDGAAQASRSLPLIVTETETIAVDRDETCLIEGWRLKADGTAIPPGLDPNGTVPVYTVNGQLKREIPVRGRERLRVRFINALQRNVIALKIEFKLNFCLSASAITRQSRSVVLAYKMAYWGKSRTTRAPRDVRRCVWASVKHEAAADRIPREGDAGPPESGLSQSQSAPWRNRRRARTHVPAGEGDRRCRERHVRAGGAGVQAGARGDQGPVVA